MSRSAEIPTGRRRHGHTHYSASPTPHLSQSMKDVLEVAPDELCNQKELKIKGKKGSASNLMSVEQKAGLQHKARQDHENEPAEVVIVCEPEGSSLMMGGLHPRSALYFICGLFRTRDMSVFAMQMIFCSNGLLASL